jgi:ribonuclease HII
MLLECGVDEAGRGPLAGNVYAAAVILDINNPIIGLADSKKLSEKKREQLFDEIITKALSYHIAIANTLEIDSLNILQATMLAMKRAIEGLHIKADVALIDGNRAPKVNLQCQTIIGGDGTIAAISAASILAKVSRDREMLKMDQLYPKYGFAKHKGYGTKEHLQALEQYGPCVIHRKSFAPISQYLRTELF